METQRTSVVLGEEDFRLLKQFADNNSRVADHAMTLSYELKRAVVVKEQNLPPDSVRLNSTVKVRDLESGKEMVLTIVLPAFANINEKKISVLTPMGSALIGLRKGDQIDWKMPAGMKTFFIMDVWQNAQ
ncbi:nucleoside diphosphate kinase regulator [Telluribacter sp. SYSU D00476]|uniref:nucleoside diphosphate kinase regulator n=1 Tax=Telluribacter sp. SYSU D00476 TaxID=2811430 RepID=UPI001FF69000|nr:nucleoside diphosphate kinase regulator [Telluribacter sp. SYSU D00476]